MADKGNLFNADARHDSLTDASNELIFLEDTREPRLFDFEDFDDPPQGHPSGPCGVISSSYMEPKADGVDFELPFLYQDKLPSFMPSQLLRYTARLDFPLTFSVWPYEKTKDVQSLGLVAWSENPVLSYLSTTTSSAWPMVLDRKATEGNIMIARADGKSLHPTQLKVVWAFFFHVLRARQPDRNLSPRMYMQFAMTPKKFIEFWTNVGAPEGKCPVRLGCNACTRDETITTCGKCGVVGWCSQGCRNSSMAAHGKVCVVL